MAELQLKLTKGKFDLELQGDKESVLELFNDIRKNGLGKLQESSIKNDSFSKTDETNSNDINTSYKQITTVPVISKSRKRKPPTLQLINNIDLYGKNGAISLKEFVSKKRPKTNIENSTAFIYYLETIINIKPITINHIYTCYKIMGLRIPNNLQQNLSDISSKRYGYANRKDGDYSMTILGINFVEHDLPAKQ